MTLLCHKLSMQEKKHNCVRNCTFYNLKIIINLNYLKNNILKKKTKIFKLRLKLKLKNHSNKILAHFFL